MSDHAEEVEVKGVMPTSNGCAIFLGNTKKTFVIYVDQAIGSAISMTLNGIKKERPLTHDLISHIFDGFEIDIQSVLINDFDEGTFFARLTIKMENELGTKIVEIDARPSDCIVMALHRQRPIRVAAQVMDHVDDMTEILEKIQNQSESDQ